MAALNVTQQCKYCQLKQVYIENGRAHDFCSRRCALASQVGQPTLAITPGLPSVQCGLAGCQRPVYIDRNGMSSKYCSNAHRLDAVKTGDAEACLFCSKWAKALVNGKLSDFCSKKCSRDALNAAPLILEVPSSSKSYAEVSDKFKDDWTNPTSTPTVVKIWKILCDRMHGNQFAQYKLAVERSTGERGANSRRRWHGTVRVCQLGDEDDQHDLCNNDGCSLCAIINSSFQLAQFGQRFKSGQFGEGIYTSATSSKANDHSVDQGGSPYKAVLLNDVVLGKSKKLTESDPTLNEPPAGYDSVIGEPGGDLNYDQCIVYKNEAIQPLFLVIYLI